MEEKYMLAYCAALVAGLWAVSLSAAAISETAGPAIGSWLTVFSVATFLGGSVAALGCAVLGAMILEDR